MSGKKIKDPLYGYINISKDIMNGIVDSAVFQRLRRVAQTSYAPLFPSAVHNRFVHSLGVYHLGQIAAGTLRKEVQANVDCKVLDEVGMDLDRIEYIFLLACLLHDVGHAPFSHTGEAFYLKDGKDYSDIHELLISVVNTDTFRQDVPTERSSSAAPHEIMSAIVGIREFSNFMVSPSEKEFFARCITGYEYSNNTECGSFLNCFVCLLNSKVIDVDKLDYLIRDAYITGYCTVAIDYERLLTSLTIVKHENKYSIAYYKGAISVIENVVYAHDSERKWIQTHPVILYESYILQHIMEMLAKKMDSDNQRLFSVESLSVSGQTFSDGTYIRLLSDDDVIYLAKKYYDESKIVTEFFDRQLRRHPLWKSEAEYKALFLDLVGEGTLLSSLENAMANTAKYLLKNTTNWAIDKELADSIKSELDGLSAAGLDEKSKETQEKEKDGILKVVKCLNEYAESNCYKGDFVLLQSDQFNSGFLKPDFSSIKIVFPSGDNSKIINFGDKVSSILGITSDRDDFFYLYYERDSSDTIELDIAKLCNNLFRAFI